MPARVMVAAGVAAAMVVVLSVQFLLGMGVNLGVQVEHARFGLGSMMAAMYGKPLLMVHMMLGMFTAALAVAAAVAAALSGRAGAATSGIVGLLAVLVAGYGGVRFLLSGSDAASFTMAAGFVVAYAAFFVELLLLLRLQPSYPRTAGWLSGLGPAGPRSPPERGAGTQRAGH